MNAFRRSLCHGIVAVASAIALVCLAWPAEAVTKGACQRYAARAIDQFRVMNEHRKCRLAPDARWQSNYQNHFNWCVSAPNPWPRAEEKARDDHLYRCGGQATY